jgi:hypothetical protein
MFSYSNAWKLDIKFWWVWWWRSQLKFIIIYEDKLVKDHFFKLNLLTFGITTLSNFFPTLLFVLVVSAIVSTFPVNTFYFPITNSIQESFLVNCSCFLAWFAVVSNGESHDGYDFFF